MFTICLQLTGEVVVVEEDEVAVQKPAVTSATHVEISAPHGKCTALKCAAFKYTYGSMRFGTWL